MRLNIITSALSLINVKPAVDMSASPSMSILTIPFQYFLPVSGSVCCTPHWRSFGWTVFTVKFRESCSSCRTSINIPEWKLNKGYMIKKLCNVSLPNCFPSSFSYVNGLHGRREFKISTPFRSFLLSQMFGSVNERPVSAVQFPKL